MPYDLFISYARRDNERGRIAELVERIKTDFAPFAKRELAPFFDQQEIHGMQDWKQRILQGLRESQPDTPFLGQLKTLLTGPELPVAGDVAVPWDIAYFIELLKPKLGEHNAEFLTTLVAALNDRTQRSALGQFPEWRGQSTVPLDTPWP